MVDLVMGPIYGLARVTRHASKVTNPVTVTNRDVRRGCFGAKLVTMPPPGVRAINGPAGVIASTVLVASTCIVVGGYSAVDDVPLVVVASVIYLAGLLVGPMLIERYAWGRAVYFPVQIALTAMLMRVDSLVMALAPLALVSHAVLYLRLRWAVPVIAVVVAVAIGPHWQNALSYATSIAFVVAFSRMATGQHDARERATRLAAELEVALANASQLASTRERNRIARDVHDGLGHTLTVVHVQLEAALDLVRRDPERAETVIRRAQSVVQSGLRDVRSSVGLLRDESRPRALTDAIAGWAAELRAEGLDVVVELPASAPTSPAAAHVLYRAAQEAVTNVRKHASAKAVEIAMTCSDGSWRLRVADDGRGTADVGAGFGLAGIRERAASLGGRVEISTRPGGGFALTLEVPS